MRPVHFPPSLADASNRPTPNPALAPLAKILFVYIADCQARCGADVEGKAWRDLRVKVTAARDFLNSVLMPEKFRGDRGVGRGGAWRRRRSG